MYADLRILLLHAQDVRSPSEYRKCVIDENCLLRSSESSRRKVWQELRGRYRLDGDDPLFSAFWKEWTSAGSEAERALAAYVLFALNDVLVWDLGVDWLYPLLRQAPAELRLTDVLAFVASVSTRHPEVSGWSEKTTERIAQHYLASIRDFGLAQGVVRKRSVRPALHAAPVRLILRALTLHGTTNNAALRCPAFRLVGLSAAEVVDALSELNGRGALRFRMQGDVIDLRIDPLM